MQNKGLIKLFALLFGLVSLYQLSFTYMNNSIESEANQIAESKFDASVEGRKKKVTAYETKYLDSLVNDTTKVYLGNSYSEVKTKSMKLGLDLKGGLEAILQVSVKDILIGLANNSQDPAFRKALEDADELQKNGQNDYVDDFYNAFDAIKGDKTLASPDIFATRSLEDEIQIGKSDDEVKTVISRKIDESINSALQVLRTRIDQFGVASPNIQRLGTSGRILVELPGVKDVERAKELITSTAELEFWDAYKGAQFFKYFEDVNNLLKSKLEVKTEAQDATVQKDSTETSETNNIIENLTGVEDSTEKEVNPLLDLVAGYGSQNGPVVFAFNIKDKATVLEFINSREARALLPAELKNVKFVFGKPKKDSELTELYVLKGTRDGIPPLSGGVVDNSRQSFDQLNRPIVTMQMNPKGARIWEQMTKQANLQGSQIAIVLDNTVYSAPGVTVAGGIAGGNSEISGDFTLNEATDLANVLRAGKLPAKAEIIQSDEIGPTLGKEAIESGTMSFLIALVLVLLWMIFYYGKAGLYADIAMLLNILLIFGILASEVVLTLPGIAGIVLTIGMSVDANVLIFERIREELTKGKDQKSAIKDGFSNALSSILDANITTGLTALILFIFGTGPIKGFATTLLVGILTSLFTAIFITRLLIDWYAEKGGKLDFSTGITKNLFRGIDVSFLKKRKIAYLISGGLILLSLVSLFTNKLDQGVDFVGGRTYQVRFAQDVNAAEITGVLASPDVFESAQAKTFGGTNQLKITTKYKIDEASEEVDEEIRQKLHKALQPYLNGLDYAGFVDNAEKEAGLMKYYKVSPTIADDIKSASFWAVLGSLVVVFLYILFRFKRWQFSLGAVAAVFHDVLLVLGVFSIAYKVAPFSMEINQAFIAAILTVIGYSLNDTVVVFDRIREFFNDHSDWPFDKVIDKSLSSTLSRTLNTSLTTLVVLLAIFIFGGDSIRGFMFALIVGVIVGTYSSLFIATPIMYDTVKRGDATEALKNKVIEEDSEELEA